MSENSTPDDSFQRACEGEKRVGEFGWNGFVRCEVNRMIVAEPFPHVIGAGYRGQEHFMQTRCMGGRNPLYHRDCTIGSRCFQTGAGMTGKVCGSYGFG